MKDLIAIKASGLILCPLFLWFTSKALVHHDADSIVWSVCLGLLIHVLTKTGERLKQDG